jgi:hypothetical protein
MTPAMAAALCAPVLRPALLVTMQFATDTAYCWTGLGPLVWNGMTFQGVGELGSISNISEDSEVEAKGITLTLSGIPSDMMTEVLNEVHVLGNVQVWFALFNEDLTLIADPILSYQGKMDAPTLNDDQQTCTATIAVENVLVDLNRACYRRYTNDDQQMDLAATLTRLGLPSATVDTGLRFVAGQQEQITFWGIMPSSINNV